jgi:hypothetical protein
VRALAGDEFLIPGCDVDAVSADRTTVFAVGGFEIDAGRSLIEGGEIDDVRAIVRQMHWDSGDGQEGIA